MSGISCERFDAELAAFVAGERVGGESLRAHASGCPRCRDAAALLDWSERPSSDRDGWEMPAPAYWARFDASLADRIRRERRSRTRGMLSAGFAAAAILAGFAWLVGSLAPAPRDPPSDDEAAILSGYETEGWDDLAGSEAGDTEAPVPPEGYGDLFPGVEGLGEGARLRLLDWLSREERRLQGGDA